MTGYLLDPSAFRQAQLNTAAARRIQELGKAESLAICTAAMLDMLAGARSQREWLTMAAAFDGLRRVELADPMAAVELHGVLARTGRHRGPVVAVLVAATAAEHGLTVLHHDHDVERLIDATGGKHEWVVPPDGGQGV